MSTIRWRWAVVFLLLFTACRIPRPNGVLRQPGIVVTFDSISESDAEAIRGGLLRQGARELTAEELDPESDFGFELPLQLRRDFSFHDLASAAAEWHEIILHLAPPNRGQVSENTRVALRLEYGSADAHASTRALLRIRPEPPGARILIDGPRPRPPFPEPEVRADYLQLELPFSFIKEHDYVFFRSVHEGVTRYFEYDLARETQRPISGIRNQKDWEYYRRHRKLPR